KVTGVVVVTVPTAHKPVTASYVPWLGVADTNVRPFGSESETVTLVAVSAPALVRVTVKVIVSPTLGTASLTLFATARSARWGVSVALAVLLAVFGSNWSEWPRKAVFVRGSGLATRAVRISVSEAPELTVPTPQIPRSES